MMVSVLVATWKAITTWAIVLYMGYCMEVYPWRQGWDYDEAVSHQWRLLLGSRGNTQQRRWLYGIWRNQQPRHTCKRLPQILVILTYHPIYGVAINKIFGEGVPLSIRLNQDIPIQARWINDPILAFSEVAIGGVHIPQHTYGRGWRGDIISR
ncbi:predicted protein [Lichtheimia corymbifera JMRC:FSU:9682]|uniref:Uncharacterized protein n=1 Tax=Lichtheimia corymbifera JMRC:FSU:9682 TaxID=1263082 RepID=A0A068SE24_9FUNG|nr:predicted protein [Lichtheimia corymbifera JMRC:FSU:9682]